MRKILFILLSTGLLSIYENNGLSFASIIETKEDITQRLNLPVKPSEVENNANLLGVNSNPKENIIRDDLERKIGLTFSNNEMARKVYNRQAELWSLMLENLSNKTELYDLFDEYIINLECKSKGYIPYPEEMKNFEGKIKNTFERYTEMIKIKKFINYDYPPKSEDQIKAYCESFK